jgi:hypothetical protein
MNKTKLGFFFLFFCSNIITAQEIIKITNSEGVAFISGDVSPNQAKKRALNNAKISALRSAGISESVKSFQMLYSSQTDKDYQQFFTNNVQTEMQGNILSYEIINEQTIQKSELELYVEITINASVVKYETLPDVNFDFNIEGIDAVYNNNDLLEFTIKTSQLSYLTIFNITDTETSVFFPNGYEKDNKLIANEVHEFPIGQIEYELYTDLQNQEMNRLLFVFTKSYIPFIKMDRDQVTTEASIFSWIYSIMPDQRKIEYFNVIVKN